MSQKQLLMRTFNKQLFEFIQDLEKVITTDKDLLALKSNIEMIRMSNPSLIVKQWYKHVYLPFREKIDEGDYNYFSTKSYDNEVSSLSNADKVLNIIEKLRSYINLMSEENRKHTMKYVQVLTSLSEAYAKED